MIKLKDAQIAQILPDIFSQEPEVQALSFAINNAARRLLSYCENISVYAVIDTEPDDVLDMLAVELNTQYYDASLPIERKRELIKNTLVWYMTSGTPSAVEELIATTFGEGEVVEWFEYGDLPYWFKIITNAQLTPDIMDRFAAIINRVKNVRSHLRTIEAQRTVEQPEYIGIGAISSPVVHITNAPQRQRGVSEKQGAGMGAVSSPHITVLNTKVSKATADGSLRTAAAAIASPHIIVANIPAEL